MKRISRSTGLLALLLFTIMIALAWAAKGEEGLQVEGSKLQDANLQPATSNLQPSTSPGKLDERASTTLRLGLEPYGTISWAGLNGEAELGAGANVTLGLTKNLSLVGFGEADNTDGTLIERFGGGLRYTASLGARVSLDAGVAGGYDQTGQNFFLRLPLGANFYAIHTRDVDVGVRVAYAFDIDGNGKTGTATGRGFLGPLVNLRF